MEKTCHQHRDCLRKHTEQEAEPTVPEPVPMELPVPELPRTQIIERTRHRFEDVHRLVEKGWTISAIARRLNLDRKTVRRFRDTDLDELLASARERRPNGVLEPFKAYLNARFTETQGQVSGTRLFQEIHERGYQGSRQVVRKHLAALRAGTAEPVRADIPSPRKITSWIMRPRDTLTESQDKRLLEVRLACPDITRACDLARTFADLVRHRRGYLSGVDPPGRTGRPQADAGLRRLPPPGPRRRHRRPHPPVEFRRRRRPRKQGENAQASHVWPGLVRTPPDPHPHPAMSPGVRKRHWATAQHLRSRSAASSYGLRHSEQPVQEQRRRRRSP